MSVTLRVKRFNACYIVPSQPVFDLVPKHTFPCHQLLLSERHYSPFFFECMVVLLNNEALHKSDLAVCFLEPMAYPYNVRHVGSPREFSRRFHICGGESQLRDQIKGYNCCIHKVFKKFSSSL